MLPRVYGCVTNNNGILDWMIGFIATFFTITRNRNQLQYVTITFQADLLNYHLISLHSGF
jgi:hypothetical protein